MDNTVEVSGWNSESNENIYSGSVMGICENGSEVLRNGKKNVLR